MVFGSIVSEKRQENIFGEKSEILFKIKYTLNILPSVDQSELSLMETCGNVQYLCIFNAKSLQDLLEFKWNNYAKQVHYIGFLSHLLYLIVFSAHVSYVYVYRDNS